MIRSVEPCGSYVVDRYRVVSSAELSEESDEEMRVTEVWLEEEN